MLDTHPASNCLGAELIDCIELPILVVDCELTLVSFNPAAATLLSLTHSDYGRQLHSIQMFTRIQNLEERCNHVITSGSSHRVEVASDGGSWFSLNIGCYKTNQNINGAVLTLTNVTAFRESLERAIEEREYTKAVVNTIADALVIVDSDLRIQAANQAFYALFQTSREDSHGSHLYQLGNGGWDLPRLRAMLDGNSSSKDYLESLECDHEFSGIGPRKLLLNARRLIRGSRVGKTTLITIQDITERKHAMEALRESEEELRILGRVGATLASELDLKKLVQAVTDAGRELSQAEFGAFFYNDTDEAGEKYLLYTLSGAPEEAFKNFAMPRNTEVFAPTFRGERTVRVADIRQDPRYGKNPPYHGVPAGHLPVRSYLAVPVVSRSGEVIGGLFFGHSRVGVFTERAERLVEGIAKQAAIAIDNARLFEAIRSQQARAEESEKRFRAIVETTPGCVKLVARDGTLLHINSIGLSMLGADSTEAVVGKSVYDVIAPQHREMYQEFNERICRGERGSLEFDIVGLKGLRRHMETHAAPLQTTDGFYAQLAVSLDITERQRAEQALRESEQRFRVITDATPIMVWMAGTDKRCYYFNKGWLDFVGRNLEQETGNGWADNVHPEEFDRCLQIYVSSFDARQPFEMEYRLRHRNGEYRWILDHGVPRYAPDGTFEGYVGGCLDIHDQKEAAEKLRIASEILRESEERLRLAQQVGTIGTFEWNLQTNVNRWTPELEAIYGLRQGGFASTQEAWEQMVDPEDRAAAIRQVEMSFQTDAPAQAEWRAIWPDGSIHWILGRWQVFKDKSGQPIRMTGINIDITSRKEAEQAQRRLAAIVESSDDAIVSKDLNGIVTSWNPAAEKMFGYSPKEMIGQPITVIIPRELQDDERKILETIGRGERIEHFETVRLTKSGAGIDVSLTISPVRDEGGRVIGAAKIARDITQEKKTEQALRTTERLASVGRMAATVAHEINNPLEAVTNLVYLAKCSAVRKDVQNYLGTIDEELGRISHITKQTLGFYRESTAPSAVRVGPMLAPLVSIFGARARNKGIEIRPEIRRDPEICAVAGEIRQLIANLLSNSIDAVGSGGLIRIRVDATRMNGQDSSGIRITVADSGMGISQSDRSKLFEPFFTTKKDVGTGLGLWVCTNIVKRHQGAIRVKSSVTPGRSWTVFSVFLPSRRESVNERLNQEV
jgi:PAS domain S-box-containing protein